MPEDTKVRELRGEKERKASTAFVGSGRKMGSTRPGGEGGSYNYCIRVPETREHDVVEEKAIFLALFSSSSSERGRKRRLRSGSKGKKRKKGPAFLKD